MSDSVGTNPYKVGDRVEGSSLGRPFSGRVVEIAGPYSVTLETPDGGRLAVTTEMIERKLMKTPACDAISRDVRNRARDGGEPDYNRVVKSRGGVELVEVVKDDSEYTKGDFAVYGPGGWQRFASRSAAERVFNQLAEEYA